MRYYALQQEEIDRMNMKRGAGLYMYVIVLCMVVWVCMVVEEKAGKWFEL